MKYAVLVYQAGLANVFQVRSLNMSNFGRTARRLLQSDFRTCEAFARGLSAAGVKVATAGCNQAGDIVASHWTTDLDSLPLSDKFRPVDSLRPVKRVLSKKERMERQAEYDDAHGDSLDPAGPWGYP